MVRSDHAIARAALPPGHTGKHLELRVIAARNAPL